MYAVDSDPDADTPEVRGSQEPGSEEREAEGNSYAELVEIARAHGAEEIKHLTRAYQAIAPEGGGRMIDLTALLDKASSDTK